jgi:GTP-binding protein
MAPCVAVLVNKWDYAEDAMNEGRLEKYKNIREYRDAFEKSVRELLFFLPDSPILFVSAKTGWFVENILQVASSLNERMNAKLPTPAINRLLQKMFERRAPARKEGKRFKAYYSLQTGNRPITIRIFCNSVEKMDDNYRRYLEHGFTEKFNLQGCTMKFVLVGKPPRTSQT